MFTCYRVPMELIGGTKIFFQVFSNLSDYFIFKLYFHTVVFKDSLYQRKGYSSLFCAEQVKRFVVKILFILVS